MAGEILTRCGNRCDLCLAYRENIDKEDRRAQLSDGWFKCFGFRINPEQILCDGCLACDCASSKLLDTGCPVRPCVTRKGLENCSQCGDFICDKFKERCVDFDKIKLQFDGNISHKDYAMFIKPYENFKRMSEQKTLNSEYSRMLNARIVPDDDKIFDFMGETHSELWKMVTVHIAENYALEKKLFFAGKNYGWALRYKRKSSTVTTLYPERFAFTMLFTFGKKELHNIDDIRDTLAEKTYRQIQETHQYHDGKWVWLRVKDKQDVSDAIKLLHVKRNPLKKS